MTRAARNQALRLLSNWSLCRNKYIYFHMRGAETFQWKHRRAQTPHPDRCFKNKYHVELDSQLVAGVFGQFVAVMCKKKKLSKIVFILNDVFQFWTINSIVAYTLISSVPRYTV